MKEVVICDDGRTRCAHRAEDPAFRAYHDHGFGRPNADETAIFEKLCLEVLASGLAFHMILAKKPLLREAFAGFDPDRVAAFDDADLNRLMHTDGVIHNARKLRACFVNARAVVALRAEGGLPALLWAHEPGPDERPDRVTLDWMRANPTNASSAALAKALKAKGFQWVGPTVCYGLFQGMGLVNDHLEGCEFRAPCDADRAAFVPPAGAGGAPPHTTC